MTKLAAIGSTVSMACKMAGLLARLVEAQGFNLGPTVIGTTNLQISHRFNAAGAAAPRHQNKARPPRQHRPHRR